MDTVCPRERDSPMPDSPEGTEADLLDGGDAGTSIIRGGLLRLGGYALGTCASVVTTAVVIRSLGVVDTGRFVTVMALVVIAGSISDLGLTTIGIREYSVRPREEGHRFLRNLLGMRITFAIAGLGVAVAFAAIVDYPAAMVLGTIIAGLGFLLYAAQQSLTIPLYVRLRFGWLAGVQLLFQLGVLVDAALFAFAGAGLLVFLGIQVPIMVPVLGLTAMLGGRETRTLPALDRGEWRRMLSQILPYAAATVLAALYFRVAQIMVSLLSTGVQAGYFGASFRLLDGLTTIPPLLASTAFPILARSARTDARRFRYAGRRIAETMVIAGVGLSLIVFLGAKFAIGLIAGSGFGAAVDVLRILAIALVGTFVIAARGYALLSLGRMRAILISNIIALGTVVVASVPLIRAHGAIGAAIALVVAELALAVSYEVALTRYERDLRLPLRFLARVACAASLAALPAILLDLSSLAMACVGALIFGGALLALGAVPIELRSPLWRTRAPGRAQA
jgi:O-antigen/teichoic acid export membrane protein